MKHGPNAERHSYLEIRSDDVKLNLCGLHRKMLRGTVDHIHWSKFRRLHCARRRRRWEKPCFDPQSCRKF